MPAVPELLFVATSYSVTVKRRIINYMSSVVYDYFEPNQILVKEKRIAFL